MPSTSEKQARLMAACAHGAGYDKCPPKKVAKEFNKADKETGILKKSFKEWVNEGIDQEHMSRCRVLAAHHKVPVAQIMSQVRQGAKVELEHTKSKAEATKIAFDHLKEKPNYYTALANMEKGECDK
jgi:hypothetical protein